MQVPSNDGYSHQITAVAEQQGGYLRRNQLRGLGLSDNAIQHRVARGT